MNRINYIGCYYKESETFVIERPQGSNDHLLLLFHTPITLVLKDKILQCPSSTLILYAKGHPQHYYNHEHGFVNDFIHINNNDLIKITTALKLPLNTPIPVTNTQSLHHLFLEIEREHLKENIGYEYMCEILINRILIEATRSNIASANNTIVYNHEESIRELRLTIMSSLEKPWTIDSMCHHIDLSRSRFSNLYKQIFGESPKKDLQLMRIDLSRRLLTSTNLSISEIALRVGYESIYHFSKQFKRVTDQSPLHYRKISKAT